MTTAPFQLFYRIDPLPDFLADHTLPGRSEGERLREHAARWVQLVSSLWSWRDRAAFTLRYIADGGRIRTFLAAVPARLADAQPLRAELDVLLRTHRLLNHGPAVPFAEFHEASSLRNPAFLELTQQSIAGLWSPQPLAARELGDRRSADHASPPVVYPWRGPGGPFLLPMESLISQPVKSVLSIHLTPTQLLPAEWDWLAAMARESQSLSEENLTAIGRAASSRRADPAAALAARLYASSLRRLSAAPFLVAVQVAADAGRTDAARGLAGAVQALVHDEPLLPLQPDQAGLPTGAALAPNPSPPDSAGLYESLVMSPAAGPLARLPLLTDALGAATVFRPPVSVRGGVPGIVVRQLPPDFHPGPRLARPPADEPHIRLGAFEGGGGAFIPVRDLTRHAMITGFTGSGKSVTALQILHQLWADHRVPFLVLESAKAEYRGLCNVPAMTRGPAPLRIFTLGNENAVPLRLNPFELLRGVRLEAHISRLQTCLEAAVPPIGPSASLIAEALINVYADEGWRLTDVRPLAGPVHRRFPTLRTFVDAIERLITRRGYRGETLDNLRAALVGRFQPLLLGGKGLLYDVQRSDPEPAELFSSPAILELNDLSLDDKALAAMFILTLLREHREVHKGDGSRLLHVALVEEAHNILEDVGPEASGEGATKSDARHKAVQAFCSMLTEVRALGQGLIIADQSPEKLARDALRNTNLLLAHQLRDAADRSAVAAAMIMDDEQRDFLGKLDRGCAALFRTGLEKAAFVRIDPYASSPADPGFGFRSNVSDDELRAYMDAHGRLAPGRRRVDLPEPGCRLCSSPCLFRDRAFAAAADPAARAAARRWLRDASAQSRARSGAPLADLWAQAARRAALAMTDHDQPPHDDALWCHFIHEWRRATDGEGYTPEQIALDHDHRRLLLAAREQPTPLTVSARPAALQGAAP